MICTALPFAHGSLVNDSKENYDYDVTILYKNCMNPSYEVTPQGQFAFICSPFCRLYLAHLITDLAKYDPFLFLCLSFEVMSLVLKCGFEVFMKRKT